MDRDIFSVYKSNRKNKKYQVLTPANTWIFFGDSSYEDYTKHKDKKRKEKYILRHSKENWNDPYTAGFWSRWLLWNKPTLNESIRDTQRNFGILINLNKNLF